MLQQYMRVHCKPIVGLAALRERRRLSSITLISGGKATTPVVPVVFGAFKTHVEVVFLG